MATSKNAPKAPVGEFKQLTIKCKTKLNKDDTSPVESQVTVVFDNDDEAMKFAARAAVIQWQARARMAGSIPTEDTCTISDMAKRSGGGGFKVTPDSLANRVNKMDEASYRDTLTKLGIDTKSIDKMVKAKYSK